MLRLTLVLGAGLAFLLTAVETPAQDSYAFTGGGLFEGCVPPCLCPMILHSDVSGEFVLTFVDKMDDFEEYTIENFEMFVNIDPGSIELSGAGTYRRNRSENPALQEMILDVVIDKEAVTFESGVVAGGQDLLLLDITLDDGGTCMRRGLAIIAKPFHGDPVFLRGDVTGDGVFNALLDALHLLAYQFVLDSPEPPCLEAADADDDGTLNGLVDALRILNMGFSPGTTPLPPPFPECGFGDVELGCDRQACL